MTNKTTQQILKIINKEFKIKIHLYKKIMYKRIINMFKIKKVKFKIHKSKKTKIKI